YFDNSNGRTEDLFLRNPVPDRHILPNGWKDIEPGFGVPYENRWFIFGRYSSFPHDEFYTSCLSLFKMSEKSFKIVLGDHGTIQNGRIEQRIADFDLLGRFIKSFLEILCH